MPLTDEAQFGKPGIDLTSYPFYLTATEHGQIVATCSIKIQAGVCMVIDLIVAHTKRGQGIGTQLMNQIEQHAKENKVHKIRLLTGEAWPSAKFYEKLGYAKTARRPNDFHHVDFVEYTKLI